MMKSVILLLISILPVIIIGTYIYKKDKDKEPLGMIIKLFIGGILSTIIAIIIELSFSSSFDLENIQNSNFIVMFFKIFIGIALAEEISKWVIAYSFSYNSKHFNEYYDIILYSVFVALGFACLENILYVFQNGLSIGIFRLFTAVPAHCFFGIIMGEYLGLAKISGENQNIRLKRKNMFLSVFLPALFHCAYDYFAILSSSWFFSILLFLITLVFGYVISIKKIMRISALSSNQHNINCANCGAILRGEYCSMCGKKNC